MRVVVFCQAYNEETFIRRNLENVYDYVDMIVVTEGVLTPHGDLSRQSTDRTWREILNFKKEKEPLSFKGESLLQQSGKIHTMPAYIGEVNTREAWEGANKNYMLSYADLKDDDLIYILDCDEFLLPQRLKAIIQYFRDTPEANCVRLLEKQFAYGLDWWFPSSHPRFFRYKEGAKFGNTNHFFHPVICSECGSRKKNINITKRHDRSFDGLFHLCWSKHPAHIREKVVSFNRVSFTSWFNHVYLEWPDDPDLAYANNKKIPPYFGTGFTEGMRESLQEFKGELPAALDGLELNWLDFVREHKGTLKISDSNKAPSFKKEGSLWIPK